MIFIAYLALFSAAFYLSIWTWNRAMAMGGKSASETKIADVMFAVSVCLLVFALKNI